MSDQSRLCDKHGEVVLFFGNNGPDDPGEFPWCEAAHWKAEAMAARTVVDAAMEILDNWRDLHSGVGDGLTDYEAIRRSNEAREGE